MYVLKVLYHIRAAIMLILYKIIYGNKFRYGKHFTFRKGFSAMIDKNARIIIGENCFFNCYCTIDAAQEIEIGDGTIFGENVKIYDHNHKFRRTDMLIKNQGYTCGRVYIGKNCWVGSNVVILKGVTIGDNCVIGAGCVIEADVPSDTLVKSSNEYKHIQIIRQGE